MSDDEPQGRDDEATQDGSQDESHDGSQAGSQGASSGRSGDDDGPGITDDQLPDDVRPEEDNPLAYGPTDDDEDEGMSMGGDDPV